MDYIFDIDNTISDDEHRKYLLDTDPKDWDTYYSKLVDDAPLTPSIAVLNSLWMQGHNIILCTGRPEKYRDLTVQWLEHYNIPADALFMRQPKHKNMRNAEVKRELIKDILDAGWQPVGVFEDNPSSVEMWKSLGLFVFKIA